MKTPTNLCKQALEIWESKFKEVVKDSGEMDAMYFAWKEVHKAGYQKNDKGIYELPYEVKASLEVTKTDDEQNLVFGWASIVEDKGIPVVDSDGHIIDESDLEKAAYNFVLISRQAGWNHKVTQGVGEVVESFVFTKEKQELLGLDLGKVGWWVGFQLADDPYKQVKSGEYSCFSIGGKAILELLEVGDE